ncbi:membrane dipeptidase [Luteimonas sp. RD2P54]|uniref:Membrane dipeptidase n=1 Tax=Luteimonas endophytica TaxID=3042023 RepID=A0ABT6J919_9GAMM|nr:membrane dipeptidase [Luteimonas endophytica]MDH5823320.1 membrane dipeptidase [Luteimonas endophytica]
MAAGAVAAALPGIGAAAGPAAAEGPAAALVERSLVVDMLAPLKIDFRPETYAGRLSAQEAAEFRASGVTAMHHAIGFGGPDAHQQVLAYLAGWNGFIARNSELFCLAGNAADLDRAKAQGRIAVIMGVQNAEHFRSAEDVAFFHQLGQRCAQLTYNSQNRLGSGGTERVDGGLSDYGVEIVAAMNAAGMLVDVSHCGDRTTLDAIEASSGPIAITHSNCRALNDHPRLKTDEAIRKLAARGGVMGITGVRNFVRDREPTTVEHVVDHIDHVARLVGVEHVGIGSDADLHGYDDMPPDQLEMLRGLYKSSYAFRDRLDTDGFDSPRKFHALAAALIARGYSDSDIALVLGGNFRRLLGQIWG